MPVLKFKDSPSHQVKKDVNRKIIQTSNLMTVLIDFKNGPWDEPEPPHSHPHEQTSYIVKGEIIFYCEGEEEQHLETGDMFAVPSGKMHTIKLLSDSARLVDSFNPVREDFM